MDFQALFDFLEELQANNHKTWMDQHRKRYTRLRNQFIGWLDHLDAEVAAIDPEYYPTPGKRGINRINNNLMFHPDRPVYKDHFGAGLDKAPGTADFYIEVGLSQSMLAGGLWRPGRERLQSVREAIDYNGEVLQAILEKPSFKKTFGGLYPDQALQRMPKGYAADHPQAELLRQKTFAVSRPLTRAEILAPGFEALVLETYREMLPFRRYLNQALTV
ncbi:DUF2461 domain-containing protein [Robiginitalea sp. M366]|uniref:DUF2461 domain-containing protein n=1 Tax=Robiginitalea aestuariiviva TaxID=3036903 RepID=UPI00240E5EAC|nr:DUF2461 domain-containing protein [Robiginitalea aestuariiviva]MDG1573399.1 DUF2461 domain-containing protein [Robiginitalea aestuariiviva]